MEGQRCAQPSYGRVEQNGEVGDQGQQVVPAGEVGAFVGEQDGCSSW
ncbi:hypothetical protein [Kitasatospora albolonga]